MWYLGSFITPGLEVLVTDDTWSYLGTQLNWWSLTRLSPTMCHVIVAALHCNIIRGVRVFTHDFIIPQMAWVGGKMWALLSIAGTWAACGPLLDSWQVDRSPARERQFHGPHCLHWLLLWSQESRARDSRINLLRSPGASWSEEVIIIILITIIRTVIIVASWPYKPGVPCVFTGALPFYWLRALILIRLRECQEFRKNHPSNEIIKVIYANQLCCQLIKTGVPPLESEEVHLFS